MVTPVMPLVVSHFFEAMLEKIVLIFYNYLRINFLLQDFYSSMLNFLRRHVLQNPRGERAARQAMEELRERVERVHQFQARQELRAREEQRERVHQFQARQELRAREEQRERVELVQQFQARQELRERVRLLRERGGPRPFSKFCNKKDRCRRLRSKQCKFAHHPADLAKRKVLRDPYFLPLLITNTPTCTRVWRTDCMRDNCQYLHQEDLDNWLVGLDKDDTEYIIELRVRGDPSELLAIYDSGRRQIVSSYEISWTMWCIFHDYYLALIVESDLESLDRAAIYRQFEMNLAETRSKELQHNPSELVSVTLTDPDINCELCFDDGFGDTKIAFKCQADGHIICLGCLVSYLRSKVDLMPVLSAGITGIYCPFERNHLLVATRVFRAITRATDEYSDDLEQAEVILHSRYQQQRQHEIEASTKNAARELFLIEGQTGVLVNEIENKILLDVCPNCTRPYIYDGCESIYCDQQTGGCGYYFCNVCLVYKSIGDAHGHVRECIETNVPKNDNDYFLVDREKWKFEQRCRRIRDFFNDNNISDATSILVQLYDRHKELRPYIVSQFPKYSVALTGK